MVSPYVNLNSKKVMNNKPKYAHSEINGAVLTSVYAFPSLQCEFVFEVSPCVKRKSISEVKFCASIKEQQ